MVKSVKAIILASVMVSMSMMLINSCGVSSPTASTGNTGVSGLSAATGGCVPSVPGMPDPSIYLPTGISSDAAKALLENPNANPNASGTPVPFNQVCGVYRIVQFDRVNSTGIFFHMKQVFYPNGNVTFNGSPKYVDPGGPWTNYTDISYSIPINLLPPDASVPPDMFLGKGYPDGDYVIGGDWFSLVGGKATWKGRVTPCTPDGARPKKPKTLTDLTIEPATLTVGVGQTASFSAIAHYSDGSTQDVTADAVTTWEPVTFLISMNLDAPPSTGGTAIAANPTTTPLGLLGLSGLTNGNTTTTLAPNLRQALNLVTYTSPDTGQGNGQVSYKGLTRTFSMIVKNLGLKEIVVTPPTATIYIHENANSALRTQQYKAMGKYYTAPDKDITTSASWNSSNNTVATIDTSGLATAGVMPGSVSVTANIGLVTSNKAELCVQCWDHKYWMQNDPEWSNVFYATYTDLGTISYTIHSTPPRDIYDHTIGGRGCTMTCVAMALTTTGTSYNPQQLNSDMKLNGYYTNNDVNPETLAEYSNGVIKSSYYASKYGVDIRAALDNCDFVIVSIPPSSGGTGSHWVVVTGYEKGTDTYYILNPANSNKTKITFDMIQSSNASVLIGSIHDSVI